MRDDEIIISVLEYMGMSDDDLYIELGKRLKSPDKNNLSTGKQLWHEVADELRQFLCDIETKTPKPSVLKHVSIDGRELILAILPLITEITGKGIPVAVPILALLLKRGLADLCSTDSKS